MGFPLVYLGEHYVVDLLAGLLTAIVAWKLAARWSHADTWAKAAVSAPATVDAVGNRS